MIDLQDKEELWPNKWVRVMCDYCAEPTWMYRSGPMDPETLPISEELVSDLMDWFHVFNRSSAFDPFPEYDEWCVTGKALAIRLKKELPDDWTVVYFDPTKTTDDVDQNRSEFEYEITL